ncbi:MAG: glycoside hydrolase family 2 protein [Oscillospiraceae bacterium]|nr:glycoside hydrolase family 2 protein [Oscillospiraceae bacterium]
MQKQSLNGLWNLSIIGGTLSGEALPAQIPGSVYAALLEQRKMEDPYYRMNELDALKIMEGDFTFTRSFDMETSHGKTLLRCEGLDTICDLQLNGQSLGRADNMHRIWEFDITGIVRQKDNTLILTFRSPTKYIAERYEEVFTDGSTDAMRGFSQLRKAHCMFGWDWGPRLPDAGIWRDISVINIETGRIDSVYITQKHSDGKVELGFETEASPGDIDISVTSPDGTVLRSCGEPIVIENPELWWPNGYGGQPLYTVRAVLTANGREIDTWERRIGLRTMTVTREKDEWGESFAITVNGVQIFSMGADYIPEDNILSRITPKRTRRLLEECTAANFNTIRVWGGGYYPDDFFYDICDELGLVVWQDFMFACAVYELTPAFDENIRAEVADNVKRLRHHPSLGLWCGNNELEMLYDSYKPSFKQRADYSRIFEYIIPQVLRRHDRHTFYWPASPSSGGSFDNPNDPNRGNTHYWDVWHGNKPFSEFRKFHFRYASEFGFQSFPDLKTVKAFTLPEDRNIFSRVMEMHQRNQAANGKILNYLSSMYLYPADFGKLLYATQLLQADAIRYGVEHWRRNRGRCMGAIYWQLNDIWPVASWSSIDYYERRKALHYYAKRFFAPLMVSCEETGEMTERPFCVAQPEPIRKAARLSVANETMSDVNGTVSWALRNPAGETLKSGSQAVKAAACTSVWLDEMDFSDCDELSNYISYSFEVDGTVISSGTALFCMPKHFAFQDPKLSVKRDGGKLTVTAAAFAKSVELYSDDGDFILSDNFFDINAGSVTVEILRGDAKEIKARSVWDIR